MKKIFFISCLFFITASVDAQERTLLEKAADTICKCMSKTKITDSSETGITLVFRDCLVSAGLSDLMKLADERGIDFSNEKDAERLGMEIGKELMKQNCQPFIKLSMATAQKKFNKDETSDVQKTEGILVRVDNKEFRYLVMKDKNGREQSYIWLDYFEGSDELVGDKAKNYIGKKLSISWKEKEVYLPSAGNYFKIKQIVGITPTN